MTAEHTVKSKNVTRFSISCPADAGGIRDALADVDPRARLLSFEEDGIANFGEKTLEEVYKALEKFGFYRNSRQKAVAAM